MSGRKDVLGLSKVVRGPDEVFTGHNPCARRVPEAATMVLKELLHPPLASGVAAEQGLHA